MKTPRISICVVAKNAAKTHERLFNSLREFADRGGDMVLVDTGSTDGTQTLYRAFGFRVFEEGDRFRIPIPDEAVDEINGKAVECGDKPFMEKGASLFSFADARNYAASLALNDYIINPDADEAMTAFDIDKVEAAFGQISRFRYDFVFDHKPDGSPNLEFVTDTRCSDRRFWKWAGHVHETNQAIVENATMGYVPPSVFKIEHWQVPSPTRSNYLPGLAYACYIEPKNDRNLHYYGRELMYRGFHNTAIAELKRHLELSTWDVEKSQSMVFIGDCCAAVGKPAEALDWWGRSFALSTRREPLMRMANYWYSKNEPWKVRAITAAALELPRTEFYGNTPEYFTTAPHRSMYWAMGWTGNIEGAKTHILKALEYDPDNAEYLSHLWYYFPKPRISVVIPTVRPDKLARCLETIKANAGYDNYEIVIERDNPDAPQGALVTFNKGVAKSSGELVLFLGDDTIPQKNFMVKALVSMFRQFPALDGLIGFNDMYWEGELPAHWLASKKLLPALDGKFFHEGYYHLYCDNELADRCRMLGKFYWDKNVKVLHDHPMTAGSAGDKFYARAYDPERAQHDWMLLHERAALLGFKLNVPEYKTRQK